MERDLATPADRVRWAIEHSRLALDAIAEQVGCSHSALSYWQTGKTNMVNVKVGLLLEFCRATGANMHWLLTGDGPRLAFYGTTGSEPPLMTAARHIVQDTTPELAETAYRLLQALDRPAAEPAAKIRR